MILEGANLFFESDLFNIYMVNSVNAGKYSMIIPKNIGEKLEMVVSIHREKIFNDVQSGVKTKDDLVNDFSKLFKDATSKISDGMVVIPMLNEDEFKNIVTNMDKQKMFDETKKIGAITSEIYNKLSNAGIPKSKINQKLLFIVESDTDLSFVNWLKEQMPNFVDGLKLEDVQPEKIEVENSPFMGESIFGSVNNVSIDKPVEAPVIPEPLVESPVVNDTPVGVSSTVTNDVPRDSSSIFDNAGSPISEVKTEETSQNNVFENTQENNSFFTSSVQKEIINNLDIPNSNVDVFGVSNESSNIMTNEVKQVINPNVVKNDTVSNPTPVESSKLEGTMTFEAIKTEQNMQPENNSESVTSDVGVVRKKNGGFVNLLILLVVLVVVTIISIELGKFLYSVYGA